MKKILKMITMSMAAVMVAVSGSSLVQVATEDGALAADCKRASDTSGVIDTSVEDCDGVKEVNERVYAVAQLLAGIVLGFAVLMIVYAGFKYATSQGDPKVNEQAKMQIISAAIGIGIAMLGFVIVNVFKSIMGS